MLGGIGHGLSLPELLIIPVADLPVNLCFSSNKLGTPQIPGEDIKIRAHKWKSRYVSRCLLLRSGGRESRILKDICLELRHKLYVFGSTQTQTPHC
jgi:hypothetical protein